MSGPATGTAIHLLGGTRRVGPTTLPRVKGGAPGEIIRAIIANMQVVEALREPEPVSIHISSRAGSQQFAAALAQALAERRYSKPTGDDVWLRLRGSVTGSNVRLTAKTYFLPGVRSRGNIDKLVVGSIKQTSTGSELVGLVSAPIARSTVSILGGCLAVFCLLIAAFVVSVALSTAGLTALLVAIIGAGILVVPPIVGWPLMLRYSQRANLREVGSLSRFLQTIADQAEGMTSDQAPRQ